MLIEYLSFLGLSLPLRMALTSCLLVCLIIFCELDMVEVQGHGLFL